VDVEAGSRDEVHTVLRRAQAGVNINQSELEATTAGAGGTGLILRVKEKSTEFS